MAIYEFGVRFALPVSQDLGDDLVERLGDAGCDDALVGLGRPGRIAFDFARDARNAREAILSAIADVMRALPTARLIEVTPDLVGVTEIADMVGCSRQNMRVLLATSAPAHLVPVHEGASTVWHLAPLLRWLDADKGYAVSPGLIDVAEAAMTVNLAREVSRVDAETQRVIAASLS